MDERPVSIAATDWASGQLGFIGLLRILWLKRWWVAATTIVCAGTFLAAAFILTPVYRSSVLLMPVTSERSGGSIGSALGQLGGLAALAGVKVGANDTELEEALAVLKSRQFTDGFVEDFSLRQRFFADRWDESNRRWLPGKKEPSAAQAYDYFDKRVRTLTRDTKTGLVTLKIEWRDRTEAAAWANELVKRLNLEMRRRAGDKATASLEYLKKELKTTDDLGTRAAIYRLVELQVKQIMLANVTQEYVFQVVDKALIPDEDKYIWPRKGVMLAMGLFIGLALGVFLAIVSSAIVALRAAR
ncbi:Wzz/FepE/Etk N-terminal domain-containing protein [Steroidobacter cummioxidans]|uniref:Wzz/FepE/Etk N-terminal domain-containing protein n=1 Tax=Steroidobacter cummioxidans TaxID=1803913 RepID=UPI000E3128CC|nr:Wzz/FepE/Etk N-terminal domain-containing protein [Steroidobacter cummioxidans]